MAAALGLALWMSGFAIDDALITVRYARHLAAGLGYRFNSAGPSTDGVTPLPWPFLLVPFARAPALVVLARAKAIGLAAWLAVAGGWGVAVGRAPARIEAKVAALLLLGGCLPVGAHAVTGMETGLAMALATAAALAESPWTCAAFAGLAASLRPEMVVWSVVLAVMVGPSRRVIPRTVLAATPFVVCACVRAVVFGRAAPLSLLAKPSDLAHGLAYAKAAALVSLAPVIVFTAPLAFWHARARPLALALAGIAHFAVIIAVGGDWMSYARLAAPIVPALLYAFVLASPWMAPLAAAARVAVALAIGAYELVFVAPRGRHVRAHVEALVRAARPELADAHRIAALDVGWPTAASEADIVDLAGLTDPEIAALPGGHTSKAVDPAMLLARDPDVILLYWRMEEGERRYRVVEARLAYSDLILRHYEARAILPSYGDDDAGYTVLSKRRASD